MQHADPVPEDAPIFFDARLYPHRSLSPRGFALLMALASLISLGAGLFFWLKGAWPIFGFFGLDLLLLYLAFRHSYRSGRLWEAIQLGRDLVVRRFLPSGRVLTWSFQPHWVRVHLDEPPQHGSQLTLSSHGRSLTIGAFLTPEERQEVAQALRAALQRRNRQPMPA